MRNWIIKALYRLAEFFDLLNWRLTIAAEDLRGEDGEGIIQ